MVSMQTALRKMGNSVGMIVPKAILKELGATAGTQMDVRVEEGKVVATPLRHPREGWAEAAAAVAAAEEDPDEALWQGFGNEGDDELTW
jgi:antitoxin MazE